MSESETHEQARPRLVAGRYLLLRELGRGGMGTVWLANDQLVTRHVAVKELRPPGQLSGAELDAFRRRALREATSAARIHHPNAVTLYDVIPATADDAAVYLIMELIEGPTLAQLIQSQGRLPDAVAAGYGLQLLDVLDAAHALGIIHRDVKPANVMITPGGQVKLADFGIAHIAGDARLTRSGVMGTQAYMAPELFESAPITPAADLWALGATLYAATSGHGPFDRDTTAATLRAILIDDIPVPACSPGLAAAITGLLQRDPARRAIIGQAQLRQAATVPAIPPPQIMPAPPGPPQASGPPWTGATGQASESATGGKPVLSRPAPSWEQATTTRAPSSPPFPVPPPTAPRHPPTRRRLARLLDPAEPQRRRRVIAFGTALVIAVAGGAVGGVLATRESPSSIALRLRATITNPGNGEAADIAFSPNSALLATSNTEGDDTLWKAANGTKDEDLSNGGYGGGYVAFSPDGHTLALPGNGGVELWNSATDSPGGNLTSALPVTYSVAFRPDGSMLAGGGTRGVTLWNVATQQPITTLSASGSVLAQVLFSPDGKLLAASNDTGQVYLWDVSSRRLITTLTPFGSSHGYALYTWLAFSPDGSTLAVAGGTAPDGAVRLWTVASQTWGATLTDPHANSAGVTFSPDGRVLAVADANGNVYLWNPATRKLIVTQHVSKPGLYNVAFSPDGKTLATSDDYGHVYLWNVIGG